MTIRPTRRQFVHAAAAAATLPTIVPSRILAAPPSERVSLGVIGVGARGRQDLAAFLNLKGCVVNAISDVNQRNIDAALGMIRKKYGPDHKVTVYDDFRELSAAEDIDAVLVAVPVHWHAMVARSVINAGKHIYLEKPLTMSFEESTLVRDAVRRKKVVFQIGTQQRSDLRFRWASELALNGRLGAIKEVQVGTYHGIKSEVFKTESAPDWLDWDRWVGPAPKSGYCPQKIQRHFHENITDYSLGMISCWGIHHLDIAQWGHGSQETGPTKITGTGAFPESGTCDAILRWDVRFEYDGKPPIRFTDGKTQAHGVRYVGSDHSVFVRRGTIKASDRKVLEDPANKVGTMPIKLPVSVHHAKDFIDAVKRDGGNVSPIDVAHRGDTLCQLALASIKHGKSIVWDPKAEAAVGDEAAAKLLQARTPRTGYGSAFIETA